MNFRPELAEKVMRGEKTVTRRVISDNPRSPWCEDECSLVVGRDYAVCPGRGKNAIGRVRIISTTLDHVGTLSDAEARREGFADADEFEAAFASINGMRRNGKPRFNPCALVWRVEFEVVPAEPSDPPLWGRNDA